MKGYTWATCSRVIQSEVKTLQTELHHLTELGDRLKHADALPRARVSRNPNEEIEEHLSIGQRIADLIAAFSGSLPFLLINLVAFVIWIGANTAGPKGGSL